MNKIENTIRMEDVSKDTSKYSAKASSLTHQLMIAGIVVIWIVRGSIEGATNYKIPYELTIALIVFLIGLVFSVAHYAISAIISDRFYHKIRKLHDKISENDFKNLEVSEPSWHEHFTWVCFYIKHAFMFIGYTFIIYFMFAKYW